MKGLSKKIYLLCLSAFLSLGIGLSYTPVKAYTDNAIDGSYSISTYLQLSAPSETGQSDIAHLYGTINFNNLSSGTVTLNLYNLVSIGYSALVQNAAIKTKTNTKLILAFKECQYIEFDLVVDAQDLLALLVSRNYATTINTALSYLMNNEATVFNVRSTTRSISTDITTDDILIDMNTTMGYIDSDLDDIKSDLDTISSQLTTINNTLLNMDGIGSSGGSGYSWHSYQTQYVAMLAKMGVTWDSSVLNSMYVANDLSRFNQNLVTNQFYIHPNSTLHIIHLSNSGGAYYVKQNATTYTDLLDNITSDIVNAYGNSGLVLNHITITNDTDSTIAGYFWRANASQWIYPIYWGYAVPDEVLALLGKDTKTNTLLQGILNAVGGGSTSENITGATTNINNEMNEINTLTNTYSTQITNGQTHITNEINNIDFGGLALAGAFVSNVLQSLYNNMGDFKILVTVPLIVGILVLIINRTRLFDPSETQQTRDVFHIDPETGKSTVYRTHRNTKISRGKHGERTVHTQIWNDTDLWGV